MLHFVIGNVKTLLNTDQGGVKKAVRDLLSYEPDGVEHMRRQLHPAARKKWSGRVYLMKYSKFPTGLFPRVVKWAKENKLKFTYEDQRIKPSREIVYKLKLPFKSRDYQNAALNAIKGAARGVIEVGTGGGKSAIIALTVADKGVQSLIITPDTGIREQLYKNYRQWFGPQVSKDLKAGTPIVVSNIQSLCRKKPEEFARFKMIITDEYHHSVAKTYMKLGEMCLNAFHRYGFTGTNLRVDGKDMELHGVLSSTLYKITSSELIKAGYLVPPVIKIFRWQLKGWSKYNYREAYERFCVDPEFNKFIAELAMKKAHFEKKQLLILVRRKEHGQILEDLLSDIGAKYICGDDKVSYRDEIKKDFNERRINCVIATSVFGEGQDIPNIDALINARLQAGEIETKQGIGRVLRLADGAKDFEESVKLGKEKAEVFDFLIVGNRHLVKHSVNRITQYRKEPAFKIYVERTH